MEKIICPICRSEQIKFYHKKDNYDLHRCLQCRLVFVWPVPRNLQEIYQETYYKGNETDNSVFGYSDYDQDKEPMKDIFIAYLKKLEKSVRNKKILDIGCANGYFLDLARELGWQTYGVEISQYAAAEAQKRGHQVFLGDLAQLDIKERFDCITMWDVLEHITEPISYMQRVNQLLQKDGLVAINTIDKDSIWAKLCGKHWNAIIPPEHLLFFSKQSLFFLLKQTKFIIKDSKKVGKKFSLAYIFKVLYNWQKLKIYRNLSYLFDNKFWRKVKIPINLRDNIFIIAQKIKDD
ncbi:class I SAM-dependent methyltransferase [bacterium]|mgnify:CR=1 FL=1|jgi:2-polyprenyl-3-methyl-5-hydroxy-6-metoxy-1,4-benzoquinol methylase|nr:class I SAM-dependent methyltransferase [bacterium]MBT4649405.1 class I SAM-dependent methyltransferase [bacterium]